MAARPATAPKSPQKLQRELEDLQLVLKARNGSPDRARRADAPLPRLRPAQGELVLPRRRRRRRPRAGGDDRPLQGDPRLPLGQGDVVPVVRRALRDAADHHGDQVRHALQARAAQHVRLVQPHACRPGHRGRVHARRRAARPGGRRPFGSRHLDRGAPGARRAASARRSRAWRPRRCASTSTGTRTSRWPRCSSATARRSTTRSSA